MLNFQRAEVTIVVKSIEILINYLTYGRDPWIQNPAKSCIHFSVRPWVTYETNNNN